MSLPDIAALDSLSDATLAALRARFTAVRFDPSVLAFSESIAPGIFDAVRVPLVLFALRRDSAPARVLARLFAYSDTVSHDEARAAFGDELIEPLVAANMLVRDGDGVRSPFQILPAGPIWILADDLRQGGECVMPPGPTTLQLMSSVPDKVHGAALDVGCGPGTLALLCAHRGASDTVGTDISPRAIALARFNARLNALRATFEVGDLLAPVRGRRFDFVVSQPPYVIHPPETPSVTYMHGGTMGDELAFTLLAGLPDVLMPTGRAIVLFDSAVRKDQPLHVRVRRALGAARVDVILLASPGPSPDVQATGYGSFEAPDFGPRYAEAALRYRSHLDALGIHEITHAMAALRMSPHAFTAHVPVRVLPRALEGADSLDAQLAQWFTNLDLAASNDETLVHATVHPSKRARWVEEREAPDPNDEPARAARFKPTDLATDRELSEAAFALCHVLSRSADVREAIGGYAELCGATPEEVAQQVLEFVRDGLARGLLESAAAAHG